MGLLYTLNLRNGKQGTLHVLTLDLHKNVTLLLDSGVLAEQQLNEGTKQRFASLADVVNKLEKTQVKREFLL